MGILPNHAVQQMQNRECNPRTAGLGEASHVCHMQCEMLQALSIG